MKKFIREEIFAILFVIQTVVMIVGACTIVHLENKVDKLMSAKTSIEHRGPNVRTEASNFSGYVYAEEIMTETTTCVESSTTYADPKATEATSKYVVAISGTETTTVRPYSYGGTTSHNDTNSTETTTIKQYSYGWTTPHNNTTGTETTTSKPKVYGGTTAHKDAAGTTTTTTSKQYSYGWTTPHKETTGTTNVETVDVKDMYEGSEEDLLKELEYVFGNEETLSVKKVPVFAEYLISGKKIVDSTPEWTNILVVKSKDAGIEIYSGSVKPFTDVTYCAENTVSVMKIGSAYYTSDAIISKLTEGISALEPYQELNVWTSPSCT